MQELDQTFSSSSDRWVDVPQQRVPVLIVLRGTQLGRRYLLNENYLVLGRSQQRADLVIPEDREISGRHCRIEYVPSRDAYVLRDLGSTNGTRVNGHRVESADLHDGDKLLVGAAILKFTFQDVIEAEYYHELDRMINIDDLTGLVVPRHFNGRFRQSLAQCATASRPLAALMMDMDGLKRINDTHGHHAGAGTIAAVGKLIGELLPADGLATRFGGDEFTAFAPGFDPAQGLELGERIRLAVKALPFEYSGVHPTISIGVAASPDDGNSLEQLTRRADEALYRAKAAGRDCVSL
jgi:two-component system, cell cycle response regulator